MFGKTREFSETEEHPSDGVTMDEFFGDEAGVAEAVRVDQLQQRVTQVEQQINSQFTSLAAYAQIAQEQVELVRSEAQHGKERSEQRVIELIERERADRLASSTGSSTGSSIDVAARLDTLDFQVGEIREGLQQCLSNQKALADAITDLFAPITDAPDAAPASTPLATPMSAPMDAPAATPMHSMPAPMPTPAADALPPPPVFDAPDAPTADLESPVIADDSTPSIEPVDLLVSGLVDGPIEGLSLN